jgi:divinyl protochlorophyllide a 8-vinyl-reductase
MHGSAGRIGPNAVIRLAEALVAQVGAERTVAIFREAGQSQYLDAPPAEMIDERVVTALHAALRHRLDAPQAARASIRAGELTADYLLAKRIPRLVQAVLKVLPATPAARILVAAIGRHSWTFAGSGTFTVRFRPRPRHVLAPRLQFSIAGCPVCRGASAAEPACAYYAGTFERLFRELVHSGTSVVESQCQATGAPACLFDVRW